MADGSRTFEVVAALCREGLIGWWKHIGLVAEPGNQRSHIVDNVRPDLNAATLETLAGETMTRARRAYIRSRSELLSCPSLWYHLSNELGARPLL